MDSIKICFEKSDDDLFMKSKWLGNPDVPQNFDVPDDLTFICQIRCDEIAKFDEENLLPHKGMLYFFAAIDYYFGHFDAYYPVDFYWNNDDVKVFYVEDIENQTFEQVVFVDDDNPSLKLVYVFYDVHTDDTNLKISSVSDLKSSSNTYTFEGLVNNKAGQNYMSSYHYGRTLVDIYSGESAKFLSTFKVPENDIPGDGSLHIVNADIPDMETIEIKSSNDIVSSYQSLSEISVKKGDSVSQGDVIGKSGTCNINSEVKNSLHFENGLLPKKP